MEAAESLFQCLEQAADPRRAREVRHPFQATLRLTLLGLACGQTTMAHIALFARMHWPLLKESLGFVRDHPPHATTISRTLSGVPYEQLQGLRLPERRSPQSDSPTPPWLWTCPYEAQDDQRRAESWHHENDKIQSLATGEEGWSYSVQGEPCSMRYTPGRCSWRRHQARAQRCHYGRCLSNPHLSHQPNRRLVLIPYQSDHRRLLP